MVKRKRFVALITLILLITVGIVGFSATNPTYTVSLITKLLGKTNVETLATNSQPSGNGSQETSGDKQPQTETNEKQEISPELSQQIITDYKQDVGIFFDAWKCTDILSFRTKLASAYTGEILEKHAKRAEPYLSQGIGLDVIKIDFDQVMIEKADNSTATLRADYRYTASDYSHENASPIGESHEQNVHVRVNLININSHWLITGESSL
ncbi:MAG TPA: hypothetical protein VN370_07730 [Desulfitobacteriaceae bacterium]|nr:hypothetical protein [Desulfitobacteriaceae bacterium]